MVFEVPTFFLRYCGAGGKQDKARVAARVVFPRCGGPVVSLGLAGARKTRFTANRLPRVGLRHWVCTGKV